MSNIVPISTVLSVAKSLENIEGTNIAQELNDIFMSIQKMDDDETIATYNMVCCMEDVSLNYETKVLLRVMKRSLEAQMMAIVSYAEDKPGYSTNQTKLSYKFYETKKAQRKNLLTWLFGKFG